MKEEPPETLESAISAILDGLEAPEGWRGGIGQGEGYLFAKFGATIVKPAISPEIMDIEGGIRKLIEQRIDQKKVMEDIRSRFINKIGGTSSGFWNNLSSLWTKGTTSWKLGEVGLQPAVLHFYPFYVNGERTMDAISGAESQDNGAFQAAQRDKLGLTRVDVGKHFDVHEPLIGKSGQLWYFPMWEVPFFAEYLAESTNSIDFMLRKPAGKVIQKWKHTAVLIFAGSVFYDGVTGLESGKIPPSALKPDGTPLAPTQYKLHIVDENMITIDRVIQEHLDSIDGRIPPQKYRPRDMVVAGALIAGGAAALLTVPPLISIVAIGGASWNAYMRKRGRNEYLNQVRAQIMESALETKPTPQSNFIINI